MSYIIITPYIIGEPLFDKSVGEKAKLIQGK